MMIVLMIKIILRFFVIGADDGDGDTMMRMLLLPIFHALFSSLPQSSGLL